MNRSLPLEYGKIKVNYKTLDDAVLDLGALAKAERNYGNKWTVLRALATRDLPLMREISQYFYRTSGIYARACNYYANLYRYDWYIHAKLYDESEKTKKEALVAFDKNLVYLDKTCVKKVCGDIALKVIINGCYYGYRVPDDNGHRVLIQELPPDYCRNVYNVGDAPAVEFNMKFFDDKFADPVYRMKVLKMFPKEFQKGYMLYKQNKLVDTNEIGIKRFDSGWYLLDPEYAFKFNLNSQDIPVFINAIPAILDLDAAQDLDRRRQMQQLQKIIVQTLPLDKNGDLIFDIEEARDIHQNAMEMIGQRSVGVDVLTTFTGVEAINLSDKNTTATQDDLAKGERAVYNEMGITSNVFNADGNIATSTSILQDESTMRDLLLQFQQFFDKIIEGRNAKKKKYVFKFEMLETTQHNYQTLSKIYKEQAQLGSGSRLLSQIALGHSQSSIINTAYFENEVLCLNDIMIPPLSSNTMSAEDLQILGKKNKTTQSNSQSSSDGKAGRPEKEDSEKSEKTLQNRESMS